MAFDNLCKLLSEKYPDRFVAWILGEVPRSVKVLKTELSIEPIRADSVTLRQTQFSQPSNLQDWLEQHQPSEE